MPIDPHATRWKPVEGWPWYDVSDDGQVCRSLSAPSHIATKPGRRLKPYVDRDGYERVRLCGPNLARKVFLVHRLVGAAFVSGYADGLVCAHLDGNSRNNLFSNLCWVTQAENIGHKAIHGTTARGERAAKAKLKAEQVIHIIKTYSGKRGEQAALARHYGVSAVAIAKILSRENWGHLDAD